MEKKMKFRIKVAVGNINWNSLKTSIMDLDIYGLMSASFIRWVNTKWVNPHKKKFYRKNLHMLTYLDDEILENSPYHYEKKMWLQPSNSYLWCTDKFSSFVCWKSTDEISIDVASKWSTSIVESSGIFPRTLLNESSLI